MATIADATYKIETPVSETDSNYEDFEYILAWYGRDGEYLNYLFTDWEESQNVDARALNLKNKDNIINIIESEEREVKLVAEDLTLNDLKILSSLFVAKKIIRVFKDGSTERIGIKNNGQSYRQTNGRYNLDIDIIQYEKPLPK